MKYLDTAFGQFGFAIKLLQFVEDGCLNVEDVDTPLRVVDGRSILALPDRVLDSQDDLILACQNNVSITFGAAAITLNRCREEHGLQLPDPITTETDQWVALVYQIRNAFAHDFSEPKWDLRNPRYARRYDIGSVSADLSRLHDVPFDYAHIGGPDKLYWLKDYAVRTMF